MKLKPTSKFGMGWQPDRPDARDFKFVAPENFDASAPPNDLTKYFPPCYNQNRLGSCTAQAGEALHRAKLKQLGLPDFAGSRLGLYAMTRIYEGSLASDDGASIRDTILMMLADGLIDEAEWPYNEDKVFDKPPQVLYHKALAHKVTKALRITQDYSEESRRGVHGLASLARGDAFEFGMTLFESFEDDKTFQTGIVPIPNLEREGVLGGHAMDVVSAVLNSQMPYSLPNGAILQPEPMGGYGKARNSWNVDIGVDGYFYIPFSILFDPDYTDDLWAIVAAN
jgi:hypothetical protein